MRLIELHIIQSFPVSCLNRDDVGAPKTATFGGVTRARISSQCLKRAIREMAKELDGQKEQGFFKGDRTRLIITPLADALKESGIDADVALDTARKIGDHLATFDEAAEKKGDLQVKTLMFLSPGEIAAISKSVAALFEKDPKSKDLAKGIAKACKEARIKDTADIAIFGRMVASDPSLTLEGAAMFSHALSTHKAENDIDFFSAIDEKKDKDEDAGAGMIGTLEFNSATYYRYAALNLDLLADGDHLKAMTQDERKSVVDTFIRATLTAVPGARKNSMNAATLPSYVLGIAKEKGQPLQLVNAFEEPKNDKGKIVAAAEAALKEHHSKSKETWGIKTTAEVEIPSKTLDEFCAELVKYVI
jgi:CRISPR system Cascade subunit CasC